MQILIHACKKRENYVNGFLVPRLRAQGWKKKDITVWMDDGEGNLSAYLNSYRHLPSTGDVWHLEDDVLPDSRFYEWARALSVYDGIICGFGSGQYYGLRDFGYCVDPADMFLSFPCIRIPCETIKGFLCWFDENWKKYKDLVKTGKEIDTFFATYVQKSGILAFNHKPCIVEHIDDMIGGSIANKDRGPVKALIFDDQAGLDALKRWLS